MALPIEPGDLATLAVMSFTAMVPITLTAIGEIVGEKAGVVNIGLEGIMLLAAWAAVAAYFAAGGSHLAGYAAGLAVGLLLGLLHGFIVVYLKGDQIVSGVGLNLFAAGATVVGTLALWGNYANSPPVDVPQLIEVADQRVSPLAPLTVLAGVAVWLFLTRTVAGLRLRAVGDDPRSAEAMGVNVYRVQLLAAAFAGAMAGVSGAYLSIDYIGSFTKMITAGRGFIALANVAFSGWNPLLALLGGFIFGFFEALAGFAKLKLEATAESYLLQSIPYVATLIAVALVSRRGGMPRWLGKPYVKE